MYNIIVYENKRFGNIRTFVEEGKQEPWFVAAACLALSDMYGFGAKRLYNVLMRMNEELLPSSPHLTTSEAAAEVLEKTGLELNFENPLESVCIVLKKKGSKQDVCKEHDEEP